MPRRHLMHIPLRGNACMVATYLRDLFERINKCNGDLEERFDEMRNNDESRLFYNREDETVFSVESIFRIGTEDEEANIETVREILAGLTNAEELKKMFEKSFDGENERYEVHEHLNDEEWPEYQFTFYIEKIFANVLFSDDYVQRLCILYIHRILCDYSKNKITKENLIISMKNFVLQIIKMMNDEIIQGIKTKGLLEPLSEILTNELCQNPEYILEMFEILYKNKSAQSLYYHHVMVFINFVIKYFNINAFYNADRLNESQIPITIEYINRFRNIMVNQITAENYGELKIMIEDKINRKISEQGFYKSIIPYEFSTFQTHMAFVGLDYTYFQTYLKTIEHKLITGTSLVQHFTMEDE